MIFEYRIIEELSSTERNWSTYLCTPMTYFLLNKMSKEFTQMIPVYQNVPSSFQKMILFWKHKKNGMILFYKIMIIFGMFIQTRSTTEI